MTDPGKDGSNSKSSERVVRDLRSDLSTSSGTVAYVPQSMLTSQDPSDASARQDDLTVISQRPVAAPEEFYRSMPLSELASMLEGRQLDHFAVDQMIGGGGMGAVFRGQDLRLDRVVAIKVIPAARRDPETLRRFRLEAQAAAKLDHPNIARVYYVGEAEQWNYIVFEFIDGVNIRDLVEMQGPLSVDDAVFYTRQVAEALQHAHQREVVHRDIKPSNVLVTANGAAKVVDMGLARNTALDRSTTDETASGVTLGTFDYISPEQARNPRDADVRSDLYSLGCTLFYMLTGNPPFPDGTALQKLLSHGSQAPPDPRGWREDLSDELFEITMKLMAKRPQDRYQTPAELISDLVMLAELENLPRSQSPGTMLVPNHTAQPTLVEANLPWLVAVAFLLVSTLWLASMQSPTRSFDVENVDFPLRQVAGKEDAGDIQRASKEGHAAEPGSPSTAVASGANGSMLAAASPPSEAVPVVGVASSAAGNTATAQPATLPVPSLNNPVSPVNNMASAPPLGPTIGSSPDDSPLATGIPTLSQAINSVFNLDGPTSGEAGPSTIGAEGVKQIGRLVVSAELPAGVDANDWDSSLANAVARLGQLAKTDATTPGEIEIRGRIILRRPLETQAGVLRIVGSASTADKAVVEVSQEALVGSQQSDGVWHLQSAKLNVQGVAFEIQRTADAAGKSRKALFALHGSSQLEFNNCSVTVRGEALANSAASGLSSGGVSDAGQGSTGFSVVSGNDPSGGTGAAAGDAIVMRAVMSVFRGATTLIDLNFVEQTVDNRVDISLTDSLVAVSGSLLEVKSPTGDAQSQRFVRLFCNQSTIVTEQSFARLSYSGTRAPLMGLMRTSQSCIYWSPAGVPHVQIDGARRPSLSGNFNLLVFQGVANLYDANIQDMCQAFEEGERVASFGFAEASASGWLTERGSESRVRWLETSFPKLPLSESTPADFAVEDVLFGPGITPKNLPLSAAR